jgi:hypothetical protein
MMSGPSGSGHHGRVDSARTQALRAGAGLLVRAVSGVAGGLVGTSHAALRPIRRELSRVLDMAVPAVLDEVLRRVDLTGTVRRYVDLDALVSGVDLDAAAARLDVDAVAGRLDVDAVAARLDVEAVVDRLDLTRIVRERVDLDGLVAGVDVDAVAARLDIDQVIARIDLVGLAEDVIAAIDLPEIIRESSASVASDTVRGARMQGISADEAVGRAVDRLRHRRVRS